MKRILIIDDLEDYLNAISRALSGEYGVITATNMKEAKEKMDGNVDLAIVDVRLSEDDMMNRDGIIFLRWLKENYPSVPVIMMSAYKDFESAVDALNLGAEHFIKKPINLQELRGLIHSLVQKGAS